ncbi:lipopolysaccharide heptosyltransferase I [Helicobacter enhydrae]|uniref:Lipopolysaccharide heptosyltransferase 1 n=1 Tax=Helicobacter enhydrae TaxID=222136 RepID=A0A1B1U6A3_9HELI|nr:lipopolysaccharide heptosyltransferase I [Helicobacter enhydrae]ANV98232.1 lipopolysaccharide heptosyltransferase I [Helicobacter enhydrae]
MRIAIIRLSALGDIVVAMSFLPQLRNAYPDCEIDWFVDERFAEILSQSPLVDRVISLPLKRASRSFNLPLLCQIAYRQTQMPHYDMVVDMQGLCKSAILGWLLPSKDYRGFDSASIKEGVASVFYRDKVHIAYEENILKRNAKVLGLSENQMQTRDQAFGFTDMASMRAQDILAASSKLNVLLVIEASKPQKMYPIEHFVELCNLCDSVEFWVLHHTHSDLAHTLCNQTQARLLPKLNLDEVKALVASVDAIIGGDTGITHLAWAMHKPSVTLYGNTPLARFELGGRHHISLSANPKACYAKDDWSIRHIKPQEVLESLRKILQ